MSMGAPWDGFSVHWTDDDRARHGSARLSRLRRHRHAQGDDWPGHAGAADVGGESVRWRGFRLSRTSGRADQADLARRCRAVHADETARARPVRMGVGNRDGPDRTVSGTTGGPAWRM